MFVITVVLFSVLYTYNQYITYIYIYI